MLEIGHLLAVDALGKKKSAKITVRLVVMTKELQELYKIKFMAKQLKADPRVEFLWEDLASF